MADNQSMLAGLFTTPEQYQQQRQAVQRAQALEMARLDPFQQGQANIQMGINRIADVGAGALGIQDPQLQLQSFRQQVLQGVDQTDPQSLAQASYALNREGDTAGARQLAQLAQAAALNQSQVTKNMREGRAATNQVVEADGRKYLLNTLTGEKIADLGAAANKGANIKEIGVAEGTRQPVYFDVGSDSQFVVKQDPRDPTKQVRVPFNGGVDRTTAKTNIGGIKLPEGESEFVKELGKLDAKRVADAANTREAAIGELDNLQKMANLNKQEMVTGTFASGRTAVGNLFGTIGIASNKDKLAVANSEQYEKYAGNLLLDKIKKLGTNPSNTDREFIAKIIPQLENSAQARQELINYMAKKAQEVVSETTRLDDYAREKRGLTGYKPTIPLVSTGGVSGLSDDELIRQIKAERAKKGAN
jgi:hypothetical protein